MKPFITWFTLGACLLLFGCQESTQQSTDNILVAKPSMDYCNSMDMFYNDAFSFTWDEDFKLFQARIAGQQKRHMRIGAENLCMVLLDLSQTDRKAVKNPGI